MNRLKAFVRCNALTLTFFGLFLLALGGQSVAGLADFNRQQIAEGGEAVSYLRFITSSTFAVDVAENSQSEYLQFFLFIVATVWLIQIGSPESKRSDQVGRQSDREQRVGRYAGEDSPKGARAGGWRLALYSRSLGLLMLTLFVLSWLAQSIAGTAAYNAEQIQQLQDR